ncbi:helix-turn-helix domain-containing protein [Allorhizobium ampelinum]|uniref:helix-turn-helix domain-containing protein n=1 Tax=Allorhizobium ampelinum TaxID=3025782 RepID=UPI003AB9830A
MEHPITKYRRERGLTQEAFGASVDATKGQVSKWEACRSLPRPHSIVRIEDVTGMSVSASDIVRMFYHFSQGNEVAQ